MREPSLEERAALAEEASESLLDAARRVERALTDNNITFSPARERGFAYMIPNFGHFFARAVTYRD